MFNVFEVVTHCVQVFPMNAFQSVIKTGRGQLSIFKFVGVLAIPEIDAFLSKCLKE